MRRIGTFCIIYYCRDDDSDEPDIDPEVEISIKLKKE